MKTWNMIMAAAMVAGSCAGQAWGGTIESAGTGLWTNIATWLGGAVPGIDDDVFITNGCTVTIPDMLTHDVKSLTVQSGGVLTHTAHASGDTIEKYKVVLNIVNDLTIGGGGAINVEGRGYNTQNGPGAGGYAAAHGGRGGLADVVNHNAAITYDSITAPTNCGSGGNSQHGNTGGGAVILAVGGTSTVHGVISACGAAANHYAGSGGAVFLRTGKLTGSGTLKADGGSVTGGGGGGGGRVAVILTNSTDFGGVAMTAYGGYASASPGAPGTVYLERQGDTPDRGTLIVDGKDQIPGDDARREKWTTWQNGSSPSTYAFSEIVLTNGALYMLDTNDVLDIASTKLRADPSDRLDGIYLYGGTLKIPSAAFPFTNYFLRIGHASSTFDPALASLTVGTNATLRIDVPWTLNHSTALELGGILTFNAPVVLNSSLTIPAGGVMNHTENVGNSEANKLNVQINGNLEIKTPGVINVDGMGYRGGYGPGTARGGAYGGQGGIYDNTVGATYGSITAPTNCGSGGINYGSDGNAGGGAVRLQVTGTTTVDGIVSASGTDGYYYRGSGGSVFLTTGSLAGNGTLKANGGSYSGGTCGGGGRIAVILTNSTDFGNVRMQAYGGSEGGQDIRGSAGTVYREHKDQTPGQGMLTIDNNGVAASSFTFIGTNVADKTVGTVIITNAAKLAVSNDVLTVYGDWQNRVSFTGSVNSTVVFAGTNAATIYGTNTFYNFTSTNLNCTQESEAKRLNFQEARTNTVNGVLSLTGVRVDSIEGVSTWGLKANPALTHSVSNVWAGQSDASSGSQITAYDSTNMGGNVNWVFPKSGPTINTWLGAESTVWNVNGNWSEGRPTVETDAVVIPTNSYGNYPILDVTRRVKSLAISNAASMSLGGFDLTVDTHLIVAGTLAAEGAATIRVGGDLDFSGGGTFNATSSTVWVAGSAAQTVVSAGNAFYLLTISNSAAPVVFADAVVASNIVNLATPVTFAGSVTVASAFRTQGTNVTFGGAVTAATFLNANGVLAFADALTAQAFYSANGALVFSGVVATVTFTNWAGDLTFRDAFSSRDFYCAPGGMNLTFKNGETYTIGNFEVYGRSAAPMLLRSSNDGSSWNLNVTNWSQVRQVDVKDSDASSGQTIYPVASTNSGNNTNWVFSASWQTWNGAVSTVFTNENNWTPAGVPGESTRLLIDGYYYSNAPVLSGVATAAQVIVGSVTTATLTVNGNMTTLGDVEVLPNGKITHSANGGSEDYKLQLTVGRNLIVYGAINVDSKGYAGSQGPGYVAEARGGSYGGLAGKYEAANGVGPTYGSVTAPTNCGSGGYVYYGDPSHAGGGAIRLIVAGTTAVHGVISASGVDGYYYRGSGGSVFLTTGWLAGNGTVKANGGSYDSGACGGGGRVAVFLTNSTDFGNVRLQAYGGYSSASTKRGSAGTVYRQHKDQAAGHGLLVVDNNNMTVDSYSSTLINDKATDAVVGTVIVTNAAKLAISNQTLTVQGDWIIATTASFTAMTNSTVNFAGVGTATIYTNNTFFNFTCTNAGKTLVFEAGRTNTVAGLLKLGAAHSGQFVTLQSTTNGSWSYLTLTPGGTQQIARVNVKDNNAGGGQTLLAGGGSVNGGNNINWQFPPSGTMFMVR